jgi:hypothetical protein
MTTKLSKIKPLKELTAKEELEIFHKAGYSACKEFGILKSLELFDKENKLIHKYYVHRKSLCKRCKNKERWE